MLICLSVSRLIKRSTMAKNNNKVHETITKSTSTNFTKFLKYNNLFHDYYLVLISKTIFDLYNCLEKIQKHCRKWGLTVNIIKKQKLWWSKKDNPH